jgi:signal transduction histidine kinase
MKFFSIRNKFIILLFILFTLLFIALSTVLGQQSAQLVRAQLNERTRVFAALATNPIGDSFLTYQDSGTIRITQQTKRFFDLNKDITGIAIINTDGDVQYRFGDERRSRISTKNLEGFSPVISYNSDKTITQIIQPFKESLGLHRYSIVYTVSAKQIEEAVDNTSRTVVLFGLITSLLGIIIFYFVFDRQFIRPIKKVSELAGIISLGKLDQEITLRSNDEIGTLATAVNTMADKLKADIVALQEDERLKNEFIMIASHNLRTPLTIINGYIENMNMIDVDDTMKEFLHIIEKNTQKLTKLTEDMITISTVESGGALVAHQPLVIKSELDALISDFQEHIDKKKIIFTTEITLDNETCVMTKTHFKSAIGNIFENAIKFTPESGTIRCHAFIQDAVCHIEIHDSGAGISQEEKSRLFTKFHRGTDTMQYDYEGVGIGLYVSKLIIDQMGGSISIESQEGEGTRCHITLPIASDQQVKAQ